MTLPDSMSCKQALATLGAEQELNSEALTDLLEEAVFQECQFFMRRAFIPKLAQARCKRLRQLHEAGLVLGLLSQQIGQHPNAVEAEVAPSSDLPNEEANLLALLKRYHELESRIRHRLSQAVHPMKAITWYEQYEEVFQHFAEAFVQAFEQRYGGMDLHPDAKLSEWITLDELLADFNPASEAPGDALHRYYSRLKKLTSAA